MPQLVAGASLNKAGAKESPDNCRQVAAEFVGTVLLVATIVGSGIMGDNLSADDGVALLGNTLATWGILFVLITVFGPISGAHFNPIVSTVFWLRREIELSQVLAVVPAQFLGGILGTILAHGMFEENAVSFAGKDRDSAGEFLGEIVATFGLLVTILGAVQANRNDDTQGGGHQASVPMAVGLYITAGYWFTSSTSFANPAVTVARAFTGSFAGIAPSSIGTYFAGQVAGGILGLVFCEWMFAKKTAAQATATLWRAGSSCQVKR